MKIAIIQTNIMKGRKVIMIRFLNGLNRKIVNIIELEDMMYMTKKNSEITQA
jgi:hypothetical protein